ncbi:Dabb family protein [Jiella sp. MQZ9-1]|uniref:Dabb family protein n=1 Tax=Jiella flava TaxID=2816857 RepID=A0A939JTC0_9HYPH|nr:Dabb family protein [Jiella flava]MBO0663828.1 Dabb family protein [Jiella flava]MCD2472401.1 Dabb family protein [Jiella flava]
MIRHIVFFSAKDKSEVAEICSRLAVLASIPHSIRFEVLENLQVDPMSNEVDIVVYGEFADLDALKAFKAHPTYAETTARVRPMRELRVSADVLSD